MIRLQFAAVFAALAVVLASFGVASADALTVSCTGNASGSNITWSAASTGGTLPVAYLWGNGSTSTSQTVSYATGTHSMSIQATDASSTVATNTCFATVEPASALPVISSFTAAPSTITVGQSTVLSWTVSNASSTSINHGVGTVSSTSITLAPTVTTTYQLTANNPNGEKTASVQVVVNATSTGTTTPLTGSINDKIRALLQQIAALQAQLAQMIAARFGTTVDNPGFIPPGQIGKAACIILTRDLREGSQGDDVRKLQELLRQDSDLGYNASITGVFGPITQKAMKKFQEKHGIASGLSANGHVGPLSRGFFNRSCGHGLVNSEIRRDGWAATSTATSTDSDDDDDEDDDDDSSHGNKGKGNDKDKDKDDDED